MTGGRRRRRPASPEDPRRAHGARGEERAAAFLAGQGLRLVARNLRTRRGEIDLLYRRRRLYVAVEVKARADGHPAPERTVTEAQLRRIAAALESLVPWLRPAPRLLRVDVVAVRLAEPSGSPLWIPGAPWPAPARRH